MTARRKRRKSPPPCSDGPIVPGSTLYRLLQRIARAVAERFSAEELSCKRQVIRDEENGGTTQDSKIELASRCRN